ncbi:hypothetical protein Syun_019180 [Stephania yunnanensis]|uniref:Uncharacterized protein n=1 Tax=Stephania yunnanensis TaxID=152371 RepID=A0AAP0IVA6_9MAGN
MCKCRNKEKGAGEKLPGSKTLASKVILTLQKLLYHFFGNDRAIGEDACAPDDAFEDINDVHDSSSTSEPLVAPTKEFNATPTSLRTRTTTAYASGNQAKRKRKVSNDVYIGDQMVEVAQIMVNEISKVTCAIRVEHDLREFFINAMAEVHELTDVERVI